MAEGTVNVSVDTESLKKLAKDLRAAVPESYKQFRVHMKAAGRVVADDAKRRASFSTRIPGSIKVSATGFGTTVKVVAKAPDAGPIENDGKGNVRHPVFGNRNVWTEKNSHPAYLAPALAANTEKVQAIVEDAITETFNATGWRE